MIILLQPNDISKFWPGIKETVVATLAPSVMDVERCAASALKNLLNGSHQCWAICSEKEGVRFLHGFLISTVLSHQIYGYNFLYLSNLYGFREIADELAYEIIDRLVLFARENSCRYLKMETKNSRVMSLAEMTGFVADTTVYRREV